MPPKRQVPTSQMAARWLRSLDWISRHVEFDCIRFAPRYVALTQQVKALLGPDELLTGGGATPWHLPHLPIPLPDRKRFTKQTKIPDFFKKAKKVEKNKQKKIHHYFKPIQR